MSQQGQNLPTDGLVIGKDGTRRWYRNGKLHREDGPAVEYADGVKIWFFCGELHCDDGPAYESANGHKEWWFLNKQHRIDGPAIVRADGREEWYIAGVKLSPEEIKGIVDREEAKVAAKIVAEVYGGIAEDIEPAQPLRFKRHRPVP
jgi:hypothetical protein